MNRISETDLILNADGSVYHLNLLPGDVAGTVITVGDPDRVGEVSKYFDHIELKKSKREFTTHTGTVGGKRLTVLSTGIGTDNIDIVMNELDALVNIDLSTRQPKKEIKSLDIVRIGTSGAIQADIPVDSLLVSEMAFGMDTLMHYYQQRLSAVEQQLINEFKAALPGIHPFTPYVASADRSLIGLLAKGLPQGITISAPGFYAPQGREVRAKLATAGLMEAIQRFSLGTQHITNLEMETAGIYGMASILGHRAISFNVILANRITQQFSMQPQQIIDASIRQVLERLTVLK
ncbi:nucleoside phosphorylase [Mucilaginibacter ginsenosidivorans]|uniref:Uridine phosphorylase n=1 Tax=Mucilaginibacter ginsenosidivorans TaxID=398053 RepID=A0A5B8UW31_9SPHI|nr:nucleoside phosphorylase [Mucilaginibacter ginsenosidivorans]QEC63163.1 phosphorylase [Mucilaginibacter ginsenosidivorans]